MTPSRRTRLSLRAIALTYIALLLLVPLGAILYRTFEHGIDLFWQYSTTPAAIHAFWLTVEVVAIATVLNTIFGVVLALALVRGRLPGRGLVQAVVDVPFAVSPVVVGVALVAVYGSRDGWLGPWFADNGLDIIFSVPAIVIATVFVTLPFVVREVEPVLREIGTEQEQAAATLGASGWQTFWRITLPAIRWGLGYGVVLSVARGLGEYGAVSIVVNNVAGDTQTLTLLVKSRYDSIATLDSTGAYAAATLLMILAVVVLVAMTILDSRRRDRT